MIATTTDCQKLQDWRANRPCCNFWWSVIVAITRGQFLRAGRGRKHVCNDICHTVGLGDISTSGLDGHIAISGYPLMLHLFVNTFFEFGVVENFGDGYACRGQSACNEIIQRVVSSRSPWSFLTNKAMDPSGADQ